MTTETRTTATATTAIVTSEKFGIEIEFNNITRIKAAEIINTALNGTLTENDILNIYVIEDQQGRKWTITRDSSIDGPADEECELATPPIYTADLPILKEIITSLNAAGAKSSNARHCGIHMQSYEQSLTKMELLLIMFLFRTMFSTRRVRPPA